MSLKSYWGSFKFTTNDTVWQIVYDYLSLWLYLALFGLSLGETAWS